MSIYGYIYIVRSVATDFLPSRPSVTRTFDLLPSANRRSTSVVPQAYESKHDMAPQVLTEHAALRRLDGRKVVTGVGRQRSWTLQLLLHGLCNAPATLLDAATAASWPLPRSCNAPGRCNCCFRASATLLQRSRTLQLLLPGLCNAPATLPDTATAASWPLQRSCNAPGRCNCCFPGLSCRHCNCCFMWRLSATLLQRSQTLQLLLLGLCNAPATLLDAATAASWSLQRSCNAPRTLQRNAPATLPDAATAASSPLQRSCNAPGRCNCCFLASVDHVT